MQITTHAANVHDAILRVKVNEPVPILLLSDVHFDSKKCLRQLLKKHLEYIKDHNGYVFCFGDWFDVMGTFRDPRYGILMRLDNSILILTLPSRNA